MLTSNLVHLGNIFCHLNKPDISLQGFCTNNFALRNKAGAYKKKLGV